MLQPSSSKGSLSQKHFSLFLYPNSTLKNISISHSHVRTYSISHSHVREAIRLIGKLQPILPRSFVKPDLNTDEKNHDQVFNESFHRYIECI